MNNKYTVRKLTLVRMYSICVYILVYKYVYILVYTYLYSILSSVCKLIWVWLQRMFHGSSIGKRARLRPLACIIFSINTMTNFCARFSTYLIPSVYFRNRWFHLLLSKIYCMYDCTLLRQPPFVIHGLSIWILSLRRNPPVLALAK